MSRNVRKKFPITPVKANKQRRRRISDTSSSSFDLSDDEDGYSALEDISDLSDDDEEDVAAAEERNIMTEAFPPTPTAPRPLALPIPVIEEDEEDGDDEGNEDDDDEDEDDEEAIEDVEIDDNASWAGIVSDAEEGYSDFNDALTFASDTQTERHVHFDVPSSDSDSTDSEDDHADLFPDIFVAQTSLDPAFRREIEHDPDESSGSGSFWDFNNQYGEHSESEVEEVYRQFSDDETPMATPLASRAPTAVSSPVPTFEEPQELDGYETDGDTTEEDEPEPPVRRKTRRPSNPLSDTSDSDANCPVKKTQRGQPRIGRFTLDHMQKKPIAVLNPLTRKMMIFTPQKLRQLDLSPEQFNFQWPMEEQSPPILSNPANMMLSAMFSNNTFGDFINTQAIGPTEAFFPFQSEANTADDSSTAGSVQGEEEDDDSEKMLNINDFITWEDDGANSSGDEGNDNWDPTTSPSRPTTARSDAGEVLSHLNSDTVGAFRRNQINQQLILSNQATQDSLAFSGPYNYTALKGLKSDRFETAAAPLTPIRRHRKQMSDLTRSPLESVSAKRKASGDADEAHKRHRSISDVNFLRI